jgi:hypothetical protein
MICFIETHKRIPIIDTVACIHPERLCFPPFLRRK